MNSLLEIFKHPKLFVFQLVGELENYLAKMTVLYNGPTH